MIARLIESEKKGPLQNARLLEADDGTTAVGTLQRELAEGRQVDFVLMDYVMVREVWSDIINGKDGKEYLNVSFICSDPHARAGCCEDYAQRSEFHRDHNRLVLVYMYVASIISVVSLVYV